jgi:membrane protease YdiL (CAAX protease family)
MAYLTFLTIPLLCLIWATSQILKSMLSSREKLIRLSPWLGLAEFWILSVGVVLTVPQIPTPANEYLVAIISAFVALAILWVYLPERKFKSKRRKEAISPRFVSGFLWLNRAVLVMACILEVTSASMLYRAGYLVGVNDLFSTIIKNLNIPLNATETSNLAQAQLRGYQQMLSGYAGIAGSTFGIGLALYSHGMVRGARAKHRLRS